MTGSYLGQKVKFYVKSIQINLFKPLNVKMDYSYVCLKVANLKIIDG